MLDSNPDDESPVLTSTPAQPQPPLVTTSRLLKVSSLACGVQFGWALQLSLLTPYVQELGIPHQWSSFIWLCGPLSGLLVQPFVGHVSDRCKLRLGRRRPFIIGGVVMIILAVVLIGFSADLGWFLGDNRGGKRARAIGSFVLGFWFLDVGNNAVQGPCRALLADLTGKDHIKNRQANIYFSLFMALGNVLGYATGSYNGWYHIFGFTVTEACSRNCANLKTAFLIDIIILAVTSYISIASAHEVPLISKSADDGTEQASEAFLWEMLGALRYLTMPIWIILIVTAVTWIGWFPFILFDTDWMGREIYKGEPNEGPNYSTGVNKGALGLMLNSIILAITSLLLEKICKKWGSGLIWGIANFIMFSCFIAMLVLTNLAKKVDYASNKGLPPNEIVIVALVIFAILGAPLAVTFSIPYTLLNSLTEPLGMGQGLAMGFLNLAIVIPQVIVSLGSGPWDQLFGGGNSPCFAFGAVASFISALVAVIAIRRTSNSAGED